ncbi:MAG: WD40 repeat domain-containing protein, partial [Gemmataceae bacterium]
ASSKLVRTLIGHTESVVTMAFAPDGKSLATGSDDKTVIIWDTATGQRRQTLTGLKDSVTTVAFSKDGTRLAIAAGSDGIHIYGLRPVAQK